MPSSLTAEHIIDTLGLRPLDVCNGFFRETWRDEHSTVMYWLLPADHCAGLHAATHPELFTYHSGAPMRMTLLRPEGQLDEHILGPDIAAGQRPQLIVPAHVWQAAQPLGDYTLSSVAVAPPFTPDIVTTPCMATLCQQYPDHAGKIRALATS